MTTSTTTTSRWRDIRRVSVASGVVATTTVPANTVTSRPVVATLTPRPDAMSGSSPVGRNSLVTETKIAPARVSRPTHGKDGRTDGLDGRADTAGPCRTRGWSAGDQRRADVT